MLWEYYTCQVHVWDETVTTEDGDKKNLGDYLDTMGQKGWELVAVASCGESDYQMLYFKRPKSK